MNSLRRVLPLAHQNPSLWTGIRAFSSSDSSTLRKSVASLLDSLSLKQGQTLVQNCGDTDVGKIVIELAKERKLQTISIIDDKPGTPETIEELKALGGDLVVPESYTKTWYMKRLVSEMSPAAGINFSDGYQATAVGKALVDGGTLVSYSKKLPKHVVYDGAARRAIEWDTFAKEKKFKVLNL
ncbi:enoyl-[acyl-carrier-protein] reductase, mitochondrial [Cocos nucifera]|uniref:Enoyl-[acyl-carrier-protein] reductase, mitochondrial n=1 Tax=Cocos nucifera TaxID=13894 RepID=A0A8K0IAU9_COCNU|nr:enoyl-[acyl-carrier-protein] reductase, mitochondrial [Cocos nucifera]